MADGETVDEDLYQALVIVNGYLGPEMAFSDQPLDSGAFYGFGLKDIGWCKLLQQAKRARNGTITDDPERWGFVSFVAKERLELRPDNDKPFPVNVDGGTFMARESMLFERVGQIPLIKA